MDTYRGLKLQYFPFWGLHCSNCRGLPLLWIGNDDIGNGSKERLEVGLEGVGGAWAT